MPAENLRRPSSEGEERKKNKYVAIRVGKETVGPLRQRTVDDDMLGMLIVRVDAAKITSSVTA